MHNRKPYSQSVCILLKQISIVGIVVLSNITAAQPGFDPLRGPKPNSSPANLPSYDPFKLPEQNTSPVPNSSPIPNSSPFKPSGSDPYVLPGQNSNPASSSSPFNLGGSTQCISPAGGLGSGDPGDGGAGSGGGGGSTKTSCSAGSSALTSQPNQIPAAGTANPINVLNGNKYKRQSDLASLPGELSLEFVRHYNSQFMHNLELGVGWSHSYSIRIKPEQGLKPNEQSRLRLVQSDGRAMLFERPNTNIMKAPGKNKQADQVNNIEEHAKPAEPMRSGYLGDGELHTSAIGYKWHWPNGRVLSFDERGFLSSIEQGASRFQLHRNSGGNLNAVTDAQGRRMAFRYEKGYLASMLFNGEETFYQYSRNGQLLQITRPDGRIRKYQYNSKHSNALLTGIVDERGILIEEYRYNEQKQAVYSSKANGVEAVEVKFEEPVYEKNSFDSKRQTIVTNSLGGDTIYHIKNINGRDRVAEVSGVGCAACTATGVKYKYNNLLQVVEQSLANGERQFYEYDALGRITAQYKQQAGQAKVLLRRFKYIGKSLQASSIESPSIVGKEMRQTQLHYNKNGKIVQIDERGFSPINDSDSYQTISRSTKLKYNQQGKLLSIDGPLQGSDDTVTFAYNKQGFLSLTKAPGSELKRVLAHDKIGRPTKIQNGKNKAVTIEYSKFGTPALILQGDSSINYQYNDVGYLTSVTGFDGEQLNIKYDDANRVIEWGTEAAAIRYQWSHENDLNTVSLINKKTGEVLKNIDIVAAKSVVAKGAEAVASPYSVSEAGQITRTQTDGTRQIFTDVNGRNRIKQYLDANGGKTLYSYDDFGNLRFIDSPDSGLTQYDYDEIGRKISKINASNQAVDFSYGLNGMLQGFKFANSHAQLTYLDSDPLKLHQQTVAQNDDPLTSAIVEKRDYNKQGKVTEIQQQHKGFLNKISYQYDQQGRLIEKALKGGQTLVYRYHSEGKKEGQLDSISLKGLILNTIILSDIDIENTRDPLNPDLKHQNLRYRLADTLQVERHSDNGFLRKLNVNSVVDDSLLNYLGRKNKLPEVNESHSYLYSKNGKVIGIDKNEQPFYRYRFNGRGELDFAMTPQALYGYEYDESNNRIKTIVNGVQKKLHYQNDSNRLAKIQWQVSGTQASTNNNEQSNKTGKTTQTKTQATTTQATTKQAENRVFKDIEVQQGKDGSLQTLGNLQFGFDDNAQISEVKLRSNQKNLAHYQYNTQGERIRKIVPKNTKNATTKTTHYLYENQRLLAEANSNGEIQRQYIYAGQTPVAVHTQGQLYSLQTNHLGAPTAAYNEEGVKVWQAHYAPFGRAQIESDPDKNGIAFVLNLRLPGQYYDAETQLHYNYNRYYDPSTGRYISPDPMGLTDGPNTYAYVKNDPVNYIDPLGLLLFAFDGSGNDVEKGQEATNVVHFRDNYVGPEGELGIPGAENQHWFYVTGIGTADTKAGFKESKIDLGIASTYFGRVEAMTNYFASYLKLLHEKGRKNETIALDFVGFSRGASTARTFANIVDGIINKDYSLFNKLKNGQALEKKFTDLQSSLMCSNISFDMRFMGLFDTVPHYGFFQFNDLKQVNIGVSDSFTQVSHAMSVNEDRRLFDAVSIHATESTENTNNRLEKTFLGAHSDIGGGYREGDLSDVSFMWMVAQAESAGVTLDSKNISTRKLDIVNSPVVHSSTYWYGRDIKYMNDKTIDADKWNLNGEYGLRRKEAEDFFDDSYLVTSEINDKCKKRTCSTRRGGDGYGKNTLIGVVKTGNKENSYQQWLKDNYGLDININTDNRPIINETAREKEYDKLYGE